ncbi:MAG: rhodanese-like domain-containing protein [Paracoccaceae bacterium]
MRTEDTPSGPLEHWTPQEVAEAMARREIVLIDVRTPQEYMFEHVEGALLLPMAFLNPEHLPAQGEKRVVFHCGSGARSAKTAGFCLGEGIAPVAHMEGGFGAWKAAGLPYVGTDMATGAPKRMPGQASG